MQHISSHQNKNTSFHSDEFNNEKSLSLNAPISYKPNPHSNTKAGHVLK